MLRQSSHPASETSNRQDVKLGRSQTVMGRFSSASPMVTEGDKLGQLGQQDGIEREEAMPAVEGCILEPEQSNVVSITIEVPEAESSEERVKSKLGDKKGVKVEVERSDPEVRDEEEGEGANSVTRVASIDEDLRDSPAFKFITRPDLYKFAKVTITSPLHE